MWRYGVGSISFIVSLARHVYVRERARGYSRLFSWDLGMRPKARRETIYIKKPNENAV